MLKDCIGLKVIYAPEQEKEQVVVLQHINTPIYGDPESLVLFLDSNLSTWVLTSDLCEVKYH